MKLYIYIIALFLLFNAVFTENIPPVKNIQGPPEDFYLHQIPAEGPAQTSRGGWYIIVKNIKESIQLPINAHVYISILLRYDSFERMGNELHSVSSDGEPLIVELAGPALNITYLNQGFESRKLYSFGYWERNYEVRNGDAPARLTMNHDGVVVIQDFDPSILLSPNSETIKTLDIIDTPTIEIETNCANFKSLVVGDTVLMTSRLSDQSIASIQTMMQSSLYGISSRMSDIVSFSNASIEVTHELNGSHQLINLAPLLEAQDKDTILGVQKSFESSLSFDQPGNYEVHIRMEGSIKLPNGRERTFSRSSIHMIHVLDSQELLSLTDMAMVMDDKHNSDMIDFYIPIESWWRDLLGKKYRGYAEIWGYNLTSSSDGPILSPIGFASGMTIGDLCPEKVPGSATKVCIKLKFSKQWISRANVFPDRFELQNIYIQDSGSSLILAESLTMKVEVLGDIVMGPESNFTGIITERMLMGPRPSDLRYEPNGNSTLVISHGYCADDIPFDLKDYTNYIAFTDFQKNRNNDDFALKIYDFISNHPDGPFNRYSFVAHSQGGLAATHLVSFYWTGADNFPESDTPLRIIQSVGSPYRGTTIAGYMATLGRILGIACGSQFDLQHTGAGLWLSLIPKSVRKHLFYTTTTWDGNYSYCSLPLNSILTYKNDGVCENRFADIEFANPVYQDLQGWCHIDTMRYPSQCTNSDMNKMYNEMAPR